MKHMRYLLMSVFGAAGVSLVMSVVGAHGLLGACAVYAGYFGGFVNWRMNAGRVSYVLITAINAAVYFCALELIGLLINGKRPSSPAVRN